MTTVDIAHQRLQYQQLASPRSRKPAEVVKWLGAVQAQDYYHAKWALGLRMQNATDETVEQAFAEGAILRTHVMRPTWHFVAPADIRWLLKLTAARVNAASSYQYRKSELDDAVFKRSNKALASALRGGKHLTREVLRASVQRAGVATDDLRFIHILARAELDGVICSGARRGKQFTYALLDERVPQTKELTRAEALAELTKRYFISHGPATLPDFAWWSGLTTADCRTGLDLVQHHLVQELIAGKTYWRSSSMPVAKPESPVAHLLPVYDEYLVAYKDRSAALDTTYNKKVKLDNSMLGPAIVLRGRVVGSWKRTFDKDSVIITLNPVAPLSKADNQAVVEAAQRYAAFLKMTPLLA